MAAQPGSERPSASASAFMVDAVPIVFAVADRRGRGGDQIEKFLIIHAAGGVLLTRPPHYRAGSGALALPPAVEHGPAGQHDRRGVHRRGRHDRRRRGLVAAGGEHDSIERIAEQHLDEAEIREIAIKRRSWPFAGFPDRMRRKLECDAAGIADALAYALGEFEVMAVARR